MKNINLRFKKNNKKKTLKNPKKDEHKEMPTQIHYYQSPGGKNPQKSNRESNQKKNKSSIQENENMINN